MKLASGAVKMLKGCGLENRGIAFCVPIADESTFKEKEERLLPDLPKPETWVRDWETLPEFLPEMPTSVVLQFLRESNPLVNEDSRVWYSAMQRVMDMGNLKRLWATRPEDGIMWIGFR